ncbi:universal stress protein UspA [candidate division NPL-UPA2 bacterium]|nr:universal stress protein UspA [candidate division NPL-UPA2 bacterium]
MKSKERDKRRSSFVFGFGLLGVFAAFYFGSAMLNTAELKRLAAVTIWGIPLTIWMGLVTILSGLIITRVYLVGGEKD